METVKRELKELIISTLKLNDITPEQIDDEAPLFGEGLGLDSLDALDLVVEIEYHYGVPLDLEAEEARQVLRSVAALAQHVHTHRTSG